MTNKRKPQPISSIVRNSAGRAVGRIINLELAGQVEAFTRGGARSLGRFGTGKAARAAVRAEWRARQ